ncbi:MAG: bifunctional diaminohydroxyphosphoribosylaminopyrimidine deaminase/5-amino-6-(5-phosphoribosylamino)uracil reductase RibD [Muribaculaceae bacterium]|nr:bifunctional diaminohydroxyphosphoribosylaminopyrimidine deaminase/5-amino-6-(5-phosphoribosylamino)uracil reductase RibD [Muribaculaceae bacterium]
MKIKSDKIFMRRALQLARAGAGHVSPNPMVGAVVVHDGRIVGEGFHRRWGEGHAEVNAIASVKDRSLLPSSTVYVTLEPCSHYGKTPPCAQLLIDHRVARVVVGTLDPFEKVSGRGVAMLRESGIEVTVGILEEECRKLNRRFIKAHTAGRPWVLLKWAQSADGFIAPSQGRSALSSPLTTVFMHRERALVDAIVVGARTVAIDDPSLTVRHWSGNSPLRVVLSRRASLPAGSRLLTDGNPTLVYSQLRNVKEGAVEWVSLDTSQPASWLEDLYRRGVTSVMVEGGANVLTQLIASGLWDEARIETAPTLLHDGVPAPAITGQELSKEIHDGREIVTLAHE